MPDAYNTAAAGFWSQLWTAATFDVPHNTAVVLRGCIVLGAASGVVGTFLLLRKRSLVADALSHAALPGVCAGFVLATAAGADGRALVVLIPAAAIFGLMGVACVQLLTRLPRVQEDAAIGAVISVFFALGIVGLGLIQRMPAPGKAGLTTFIFGHAATMSAMDANAIGAAALATVIVALLFLKEFRLLCFDPRFARGLGWSVVRLDALLLSLVTAITVVGLHAVGAVLMVALLVIPAVAARFWTNRLSVMLTLAAVIGAAACHIGVAASAVAPDLPTGPAIVVACGVAFLISMLAAPRRGLLAVSWQRRRLHRRVQRQHLLRAIYELIEMRHAADGVVPLGSLLARRSWNPFQLNRLVGRLVRRAEVERVPAGIGLTASGRQAAARIVRTHRLWEHFLATQADIAPSHVDRAADDIEHVLGDDLIGALEADLRRRGALAGEGDVPASPHRLTESPASSTRAVP